MDPKGYSMGSGFDEQQVHVCFSGSLHLRDERSEDDKFTARMQGNVVIKGLSFVKARMRELEDKVARMSMTKLSTRRWYLSGNGSRKSSPVLAL